MSAEVRQCVTYDSLRVDDTRTELLPELVELTDDEESSVRLAAFDTIINLMEMMDGGESACRPVVSKCLHGVRFPQTEQSIQLDTATPSSVSSQVSVNIHPLLSQMTDSMSWFLW